MAVYEILPTTNLKWDDIRDTLNANGGNVNNSAVTAFQSGANIQRWAKYKPVVYYKDFTSMEEEWWRGDDLKCGLTVRYSPTDGDIIDIYKRGDAYTYNYLTKGPYRLGDFRGYYPKAEPYIRTNVPQDKVFEWDFNNDGDMILPIQVVRQSDTSLTINDVKLPLDMGNLNILVERYNKNPIEEDDALAKDSQNFPITGTFPFVEFRGLKSDYNVQYFLLSLTDKSINGYEVPMPYDEKNAYLIKIKNIAKAVITGSISQFALSTKKVWSNVSDYLETPYDSNGGSSSPVLFKSSIKNLSTAAITFNNTDSAVRSHTIKITATGEVNGEYKEYDIECSIWNDFGGASTSSLVISPSQTKEVIFGTSEGLFDKFREAGKNNLIYINAVVVNKNTKSENTISSIRIRIN